MTTYTLGSISPFFYSLLRDNIAIDWEKTPRVTKQEEEALETLSHRDNHDLDEKLVFNIVKAERCSSTAREEQGVGEGSSTSISGGVQLPLDGQVKEHVPGKGENVMHWDKVIQRVSGFVLAIVFLLVIAGTIRLSLINAEYLFLLLAAVAAAFFIYARLE